MSSNYYTYGTNLRNKEFFTSTVKTNYGIKRYFSNIDADVYFGDKKIEDIVEIQFSVEEQKLPIFSYNKFYADVIVPGQRIVQGTFILNFTDGKYMDTVLSEIPDSVYNETTFDQEKYNPGGNSKNSALFGKNFDIMLCYGDYKEENPSYNATVQTICGVQINNTGVALSAKTGEPILEVYSFIAKDFLGNALEQYTTGDNNQNNNNSNNNNDQKGDNNSDKNNSNKDNTNNNTSEGLTTTAYYTPKIGETYPSINVSLWHGNSKNKGMLSKHSKTAILDITDEKVINFNVGDKATNFSTKTTLEGTYKQKTSQGQNESGEHVGDFIYEMLLYSVSIQPKEYNGVEQNGQATRPIIKRLDRYFAENPDATVKGTLSYSLTVGGKTSDHKENVNITFNKDGTFNLDTFITARVKDNQNNSKDDKDKGSSSSAKGSLNASSYSVFEEDSTEGNSDLKVCFYNNDKQTSKSFNNHSKTATLNITDDKVLTMGDPETGRRRSMARDVQNSNTSFSTKTTLEGEIRKIGTTKDQRDILMYYAKYDGSRPLMRRLIRYFREHPKDSIRGTIEFSVASNGKTVEYNENVNMFYNKGKIDVEKKIYENMNFNNNGNTGGSSNSNNKDDSNNGNNNHDNTSNKYKTFGGCEEYKFNKEIGYDIGVMFLNEKATGKGTFKNHSNTAQLEITDSRVLNYDLKTLGLTNPSSNYSKTITMNYVREYVGGKTDENVAGNAVYYNAHLEPKSFGNYKLNGYMERPIVQKIRGFFLAHPNESISATAKFSMASNGKTKEYKENVKIPFLTAQGKKLTDVVEDYMNK